jgi:hypothetical protein
MGQETANVHVGDRAASAVIQKDLPERHSHWLRKAAQAMADATEEDWKQWRKKGLTEGGRRLRGGAGAT